MSKLMQKESIFGTYDFKLDDGHCVANVGIGEDWLTVYLIETEEGFRGRGEARKLLEEIKNVCDKKGKLMYMWCPMNKAVGHLCESIGIKIT